MDANTAPAAYYLLSRYDLSMVPRERSDGENPLASRFPLAIASPDCEAIDGSVGLPLEHEVGQLAKLPATWDDKPHTEKRCGRYNSLTGRRIAPAHMI
jgi:hypothetical protein